MTTRHSGWCTNYEKCFQVPSTSRAGRSEQKGKSLCVCIVEGFSFIPELGTDVATYAPFGDVVGVMHDVSGQAKVADLD